MGFAFDVEILVISRVLWFEIREMPIFWAKDPRTKVKLGKMLEMILDVIKIKLNEVKGTYKVAQ